MPTFLTATALSPLFAVDWSIGTFLTNATSTLKGWGGLFIVLLGVVMIVVAGVLIAKGLMSHGKTQTNWLIVILLFLIGGAFMVGGFSFLSDIAGGAKKSIEDIGSGTGVILPWLQMYL